MKPHFLSTQISFADFRHSVEDYPQQVPEKVQGLEELRYYEIPEALAQRRKAGEAFLEKTELKSLVEWKLKHGTYRPSLAKLVASNSLDDVRQTTSSAFSTLASSSPLDPAKAITTLCKLKGIGPATASLILSCYDATNIPFFSDESFHWLHYELNREDASQKRKSGDGTEGWYTKIKYTAKEYASVFEKTSALRKRLEKESGMEVRAVDLEKAAYDIAKRDVALLLPTSEEAAVQTSLPKQGESPQPEPQSESKTSPDASPAPKRRKM